MRTIFRTMAAVLAIAAGLASCTSDRPSIPVKGEKVFLRVNGSLDEFRSDDTRSSLVSNLRVSWTAGDAVYVYEGDTYLGTINAPDPIKDDRVAELSGEIDSPSRADAMLTFIHGNTIGSQPTVSEGKISIDLSSQSDALPFVVYGNVQYSAAALGSGLVVPFRFATSAITISAVGLTPSTAITSTSLSGVSTKCVLTLQDGAVEVSGSGEGTVTRSTGLGSSKATGGAFVKFGVPVSGATAKSLYVTLGGATFAAKGFAGNAIGAGTAISVICPTLEMRAVGIAPGIENGTLAADKAAACPGETVTLTATPAGYYELVGITAMDADNGDITLDANGNAATFEMPAKAVTASATFRKVSYNLTKVFDSKRGTFVVPASCQWGESVTVSAYPAAGYAVDAITAVGEDSTPLQVSNGVFTMPKQNVTVTVTFKPATPPVLNGIFTVNAGGTRVKFSRGNLQATYTGESYVFDFALFQYECIGKASGNTGIKSDGTNETDAVLDLFGYSTTITGVNVYYGIGYYKMASAYYGPFKDWGNAIDDQGTWRTLTGGDGGEWEYLLETRSVNGGTGEGHSYKRATVNSDSTPMYGLIIYPDDYTAQTGSGSYTCSQWAAMETAGCVFLPAAGQRFGESVSDVGEYGSYWSASTAETGYYLGQAYDMYFTSSVFDTNDLGDRHLGRAVRLVTEVE